MQYINRTYKRSGTLWEGRYKSCITSEEAYVLACYRYIELNPVAAGMVVHPADYPWQKKSGIVNSTNKETMNDAKCPLELLQWIMIVNIEINNVVTDSPKYVDSLRGGLYGRTRLLATM